MGDLRSCVRCGLRVSAGACEVFHDHEADCIWALKCRLAEAVARAEKSETLLAEFIAEVFGVREGVTEHTAAEAIERVVGLLRRALAAYDAVVQGGAEKTSEAPTGCFVIRRADSSNVLYRFDDQPVPQWWPSGMAPWRPQEYSRYEFRTAMGAREWLAGAISAGRVESGDDIRIARAYPSAPERFEDVQWDAQGEPAPTPAKEPCKTCGGYGKVRSESGHADFTPMIPCPDCTPAGREAE